ncbi:MAG: hypothetical protein Ct9H300mP14_14790 [Gammaproteobacteria bacterium]|nr:MAG: hypothetical protein Ct9H300mP14_14790 [Gammaproteobacteria bacterium]
MIENSLAERDTDSIYSVTELANLLGITPRAIRFYESKGLVSPRRAGTTRVYNYRDRGRLQIILRASDLVSVWPRSGSTCICTMPIPAKANNSRCC